jgi:putative phosphonate metabolism protein
MSARYALYYVPAEDDVLWQRACTWLGRDPVRGEDVPQAPVPGLHGITRDAALYGFHATLKPPMALRDGATQADLLAATREIAAGIPPFKLPPLDVSDLFGFLALTETEPSTGLQALADACVAGVDHLRAPATEAELARRRRAGLAAAEEANLRRWGYPYVFATWFFHMTLTAKLSEAQHAVYRPEAEAWFAEALDETRRVSDIGIFRQAAAGAPFVLTDRVKLGA